MWSGRAGSGRAGPARLKLYVKNSLHDLFLKPKNEPISASKSALQIAALQAKSRQKAARASVPHRIHTSPVHPRRASLASRGEAQALRSRLRDVSRVLRPCDCVIVVPTIFELEKLVGARGARKTWDY